MEKRMTVGSPGPDRRTVATVGARRMIRMPQLSRRSSLFTRRASKEPPGRVRLIVVILIALILVALTAALQISRRPAETEAESGVPEVVASGTEKETAPVGQLPSPTPSTVKARVPTERMTFDELMEFVDGPVYGKESRKYRIRPDEVEEWKARCDLTRQLVVSYLRSLDKEELHEALERLYDLAGRGNPIRGSHPMHTTILQLRALPLHLALVEYSTDRATWEHWAPWEIAGDSPRIIVDAFKSLDMSEEFKVWAMTYMEELEARLSKAAAERQGGQMSFWEIKMLSARARLYEGLGENLATQAKSETIDHMIEELRSGSTVGRYEKRMLLEEIAELSRELGSYDRAIDAIDIAVPMFESAREKAELRAFQADLYEESGDQENANAVRGTAITELQAHLEGAGAPGKDELGLLAQLCEKAERYHEAINYYTSWYEQASTSPKVILVDESGTVVRKETPGEREYIEARTRIAQKLLTEDESALFARSEEHVQQLRRALKDHFQQHQEMPEDLVELVEAGYVDDPAILTDPVTGQPYEYTPGLGRWDDAVILRSEPKHGLSTILNLTVGTDVIWGPDSPEETE